MSSIRKLDETPVIATSAQPQRGFTAEQKRYLADMLVKTNLHMALGGTSQAQASDVPETFWGTPVEDLCKEEKRKYEQHHCKDSQH